MFGDLNWPLNSLRGLSAIAEFLVFIVVTTCIGELQINKYIITLSAKLRRSVLKSVLSVGLFVCFFVSGSYHDNSKMRASILTKLGL